MRSRICDGILLLHAHDVPRYKKAGSIVRNSYFWALHSIADRAGRDQDWEFAAEVWPALERMLSSFAASGYLGLRETLLEFEPDTEVPVVLQRVATFLQLTPEDADDSSNPSL